MLNLSWLKHDLFYNHAKILKPKPNGENKCQPDSYQFNNPIIMWSNIT